jgi:hypothetical protein
VSGYSIVVGRCFACRETFSFNPFHVPSIPIDPVTKLPPDMGGDAARAQREPLCATCVERANVERAAKGLPLFDVHPDAYEPIEGMP